MYVKIYEKMSSGGLEVSRSIGLELSNFEIKDAITSVRFKQHIMDLHGYIILCHFCSLTETEVTC